MSASELTLSKVADLEVSAASGIVALGSALHVIADDELFIAVFDQRGQLQRRIELLPGRLPDEYVARKRRKPDFEALCTLPSGFLLALGSGSTPARMRSVTVDPQRCEAGAISDWSPLYAQLMRSVPELNIEGAAVHAGRLWLAQRGNGAAGVNACIELDLDSVMASLTGAQALDARALVAIHSVQLGAIAGVPLSLTDLAEHPDGGLLFSAAAEPSGSTYEDAPTAGSAIGVMTTRGEVLRELRVAPTCKIEGIALTQTAGASRELWLVADPDDRSLRAPLYHSAWPFG